MISLCTVLVGDKLDGYAAIMLDSVAKHSKLVKEIVIANVEFPNDYYEEYMLRPDIKVKKIGHLVRQKEYGHALGLHACMDVASQDYIMLCEPDLFFYMAVDEFYMDLYHRYNLDFVGISHHNGMGLGVGFFPYPMNLLAHKSRLPGPDWNRGLIRLGRDLHRVFDAGDRHAQEDRTIQMDGKWLLQGPIPGYYDSYANNNPNAVFDIGCNLYLWSEERKSRWLSFQTVDVRTYTTAYSRNNFKCKDRFLPGRKLLYHQTNGTRAKEEGLEMMLARYREVNR